VPAHLSLAPYFVHDPLITPIGELLGELHYLPKHPINDDDGGATTSGCGDGDVTS
jgi:hypothetical protein